MQSQIVCSGCRSLLMYPSGATTVCCAVCNAVTTVTSPGMEMSQMSQLICGGCRTLLMYASGATSVRCSCCHTVNLAPASNVAHVNCGNCRTMLMYPYGAPSVKCAVCQFITNVNQMGNVRVPIPMHRPNSTQQSTTLASNAAPMHTSQSQTVVVENPMSLDKNGKLVSNVAVGVTTDKS